MNPVIGTLRTVLPVLLVLFLGALCRKKNLITRALGAEPLVDCDIFRPSLHQGDHLLLCSDGLINTLCSQEILYETIHGGPEDDCCQRMIDIALQRGAPDNVTAVLIRL